MVVLRRGIFIALFFPFLGGFLVSDLAAQEFLEWNPRRNILFFDSEKKNADVYLGSDIRLPMEGIRRRIWFQAHGDYLDAFSDDSVRGFSASSWGISSGWERNFGKYAHFGLGIGVEQVRAEQDARLWNDEISAVKGLAYVQFTGNRWYWDWDAGFGANYHETASRLLGDVRNDTRWNKQLTVGSEFGLNWERGLAKTEPFLRIQRAELLDEEENGILTTIAVGCRYYWRFSGPLATVRPGVFGGLVHQFEDGLYSSGTFVPGATIYKVPGDSAQNDRFFLGANLIMSMRKTMDLHAKYTTEFAGGYSSHDLLLGMNWNF